MPSIDLPLEDGTIARVGRYIASEIRTELVCCDVYERLHQAFSDGGTEPNDANTSGHQICYWGEVAARIAESSSEEE